MTVMIGTRWKKLIGDVRVARGRFMLMVAAMAISSAALTTMLTCHAILTRELSRNYLDTHPASAQLLLDSVDASLIDVVRQRPGIAETEGGQTLLARAQVGPEEWASLLLFVLPDFEHWRINTVRPESGVWPPAVGSILLERAALPVTGKALGQTLTVRRGQGELQTLTIAGLVHDPALAPAWQEHAVYGYITPATLAALRWTASNQAVKIVVSGNSLDLTHVEQVSSDLSTWLQANGHAVREVRVPPPGLHPHQSQMTGALQMLLSFSVLALALGAVLAATTVWSLLAQQTRQIGMMKACGASARQIAALYGTLALALGTVAATLGVPLGFIGGCALADVSAKLFNIDIASYAVAPWLLVGAAVVCILLPALVALLPVYRAAGRTVRDLLDDHGVATAGAGDRVARFGRVLTGFRSSRVGLVLAYRNAFRRRGRLFLSLALLSTAGAMFMASLHLVSAWNGLLDEAGRDHPFDARLILSSVADQARALAAIGGDAAVRRVESWPTKGAIPTRNDGQYIVHTYPDGGHGALAVRGVPQQSNFFAHRMLVGRWLGTGDDTGVVLNQMAHSMFFPRSKPGDTISLAIPGHSARYVLLGVASEAIAPPSAFVTQSAYAALTGEDGSSTNLTVAFHQGTDADAQSKALARQLELAGMPVAAIVTEAMVRRGQGAHFYILIFALLVISAAMALVGVLGLASALSTSVVERTHEFGVMRAIGASRRAVLESVISEALFTATASYVIAVPLSLLFAFVLDVLLGRLMFQTLHLTASPLGMGLWLLTVLVGAAAASVVPALRAARLTVREALAFI